MSEESLHLGAGAISKFEATPLVIDVVRYVTAQNNLAFDLDTRTGHLFWRYQRRLPQGLSDCYGKVLVASQ